MAFNVDSHYLKSYTTEGIYIGQNQPTGLESIWIDTSAQEVGADNIPYLDSEGNLVSTNVGDALTELGQIVSAP